MKESESKDKRIKFYRVKYFLLTILKSIIMLLIIMFPGEHIILLNNDIKIISSNSIEMLMYFSKRRNRLCWG